MLQIIFAARITDITPCNDMPSRCISKRSTHSAAITCLTHSTGSTWQRFTPLPPRVRCPQSRIKLPFHPHRYQGGPWRQTGSGSMWIGKSNHLELDTWAFSEATYETGPPQGQKISKEIPWVAPSNRSGVRVCQIIGKNPERWRRHNMMLIQRYKRDQQWCSTLASLNIQSHHGTEHWCAILNL